MSQVSSGWLSDEDWRRVQSQVPILCVSLLPLQLGVAKEGWAKAVKAGFIKRATPHQGERLMLVGGRVEYCETLRAALARQIRTTLGEGVRYTVGAEVVYVAEYFPVKKRGHLFDPRQHAVAATYCFPIWGEIVVGGEASGFEWHDVEALGGGQKFGFGQDRVARACLARVAGKRWPA
jgi:ADP-ribose pyrophosphatase YjhB (NUDIX family)